MAARSGCTKGLARCNGLTFGDEDVVSNVFMVDKARRAGEASGVTKWVQGALKDKA
ncbi:unnamed protein product [Dovyalis caffra]|uniref:Uncharacterized protein n=1 Tax=Dovyalis caffra TaxID=77055 RepID=A0AAV1RLP1_9ROSI|nr:unnamed protein product [Dovyalis caffra]